MVEEIRFVLFVAAPVSLIVVPLLRAHRKARHTRESALPAADAVENPPTPGEV